MLPAMPQLNPPESATRALNAQHHSPSPYGYTLMEHLTGCDPLPCLQSAESKAHGGKTPRGGVSALAQVGSRPD